MPYGKVYAIVADLVGRGMSFSNRPSEGSGKRNIQDPHASLTDDLPKRARNIRMPKVIALVEQR